MSENPIARGYDGYEAPKGAGSQQRAGSPLTLLREVLDKDRAAIAAMKKEAPWYVPDDEILDLHRRIESCLSANRALNELGSHK